MLPRASDREPLRTERRRDTLSVAVWTLAVLATVMFLRFAADLLITIIIGVLIGMAFNPVVVWLDRRGVPRIIGALLVLVSITVATALGVYSLRGQIADVLEGIPRAAEHVRIAMQEGDADGFFAKLRAAVTEVERTAQTPTAGEDEATSQPAQRAPAEGGTNLLLRGSATMALFAGHIVAVFFLVLFLLIGGPAWKARLITIAGARRRLTNEILDEITAQVQRFLLVRLATSTIVAIVTSIVLSLMGVRQAVFWGVTAGVFNTIPYFGPMIVSIGLFIVGLMQFGDLVRAVQISGAALLITSLEGWLLTPPLMGRVARMSALTVFVGLLVWTWIWGIWGTILAVPMLATFKAICDHIEDLRPIGRLMED